MSNEEESEKPKKSFLIKAVVWDDGAVDCDIREYRKIGTGRGAPSLCGPLSPNEFKTALKNMMLSSEGVCETIGEEIGIKKELITSNSRVDTRPDDIDDIEDEEDDFQAGVSSEDLSDEVPDFSDLEID